MPHPKAPAAQDDLVARGIGGAVDCGLGRGPVFYLLSVSHVYGREILWYNGGHYGQEEAEA